LGREERADVFSPPDLGGSVNGGKRPGSGRKPLPADLKRNRVVIYLNPSEELAVWELVRKIRSNNK
jgi:hypothetical protein